MTAVAIAVPAPGPDPTCPLPPGTYDYLQVGYADIDGVRTDIPSVGSLVAGPIGLDRSQTWDRFIDPVGPPSSAIQRWSTVGVHLLETIQRQVLAGHPIEVPCWFPDPLLVVRWPVAVGQTAAAVGRCGAFDATVTTTVVGREWGTWCGRPLDLWIIDSTLSTPAPFVGDGTQRDWVSWDLASLFVRQEVELTIDVFGVHIENVMRCELLPDEGLARLLDDRGRS